jgi:hypothetical protein
MSYTYALLEVSAGTYQEIARKLKKAGYDHAFNADGAIDMHGIAVMPAAPVHDAGLHCTTCQCNKLHPTPPTPENPRSRSWHQNALTEPPKS